MGGYFTTEPHRLVRCKPIRVRRTHVSEMAVYAYNVPMFKRGPCVPAVVAHIDDGPST